MFSEREYSDEYEKANSTWTRMRHGVLNPRQAIQPVKDVKPKTFGTVAVQKFDHLIEDAI
jgi:hypothetical protein